MKCALIVPYFGILPRFFQLFLKSCEVNKHFTWYIFTDDITAYYYPDNVKVEYISFAEMQAKFKLILGEQIVLTRPYKLCDFRPAYGLIYSDLLREYDYWGYCDLDLLFGDLEKSVIPLMQKGYDKIFAAGHLTLYKNTIENNRIFMMTLDGEHLFEEYSQSEKNYGFDENGGNKKNVHNIFIEYGCSVYEQDLSFNCSDKYYSFHRSVYDPGSGEWITKRKQRAAYFWCDGSIKEFILNYKHISEHEYIYMHFQGRKKLRVSVQNDGKAIAIQPSGFIAGVSLPQNPATYKLFVPKFDVKNELRMMIFRLRIKLGRIKAALLINKGK